MGLVSNKKLDLDMSYMALAKSNEARRIKYKEFIKQEITEKELLLLRSSLQRNRLTGNTRFVDEIQTKLGIRIENRGRGRPVKNEK